MTEFILPLKVDSNLGMNRIYAGIHWAQRKKDADYIHLLVQNEIRKQRIKEQIYKVPVKITFIWNGQLDLDNFAYVRKLVIDGLKGSIIKDDSKRYVSQLIEMFSDNENTKIIVEECK